MQIVGKIGTDTTGLFGIVDLTLLLDAVFEFDKLNRITLSPGFVNDEAVDDELSESFSLINNEEESFDFSNENIGDLKTKSLDFVKNAADSELVVSVCLPNEKVEGESTFSFCVVDEGVDGALPKSILRFVNGEDVVDE